jgi:type I restriction enzyme S subunit
MSNKLSNLTTKQNQEKLEPKLRFPEFTDDLRKGIISDFGYFYYGKSCPKSSVSADGKTFCIRYGELYSKYGSEVKQIHSKTILNPSTLKLSKGGEVLVPRVGEDPLDFANTSFLPYKDVAIGEMISVYNTKENGLFISNYFNAKMKKPFARVVEGGNVSNLYFKYLESIKIFLPDKVEQEKIVTFINKIDKKIELLEDKLNSLKLFRKGLTDHIFDKLIKKYSTALFKKIYDKASEGGTPSTNNISYYSNATIPFVKIEDLKNKYLLSTNNYISELGLNNSSAWTIKPNSIIYSNGATIGSISINKIAVSTKQGILGIELKDFYDPEFIYYLMNSTFFKKEVHRITTRGTMYTAYLRDIDKIKIPDIKDTLIQKEFIKSLIKIDKKIMLIGEKVDNFNNFKKGLLQQMFI